MFPIMAGISAGTSLLGGILGSRAAKKAAAAQALAAQQAADLVGTETNAARAGVADATAAGQRGISEATGNANDVLTRVYQQIRAGESPYEAAGQVGLRGLTDFVNGGGAARELTGADMQAYDPGYQFRLDEANKALLRSQSAAGIRGGGAAKAIAQYSQNLASDEFGRAFDRFQTGRKLTYDMLSGVAGIGERSQGRSLTAGLNYGQGVSSNLMRGAETSADLGFRGQATIGEMGMRGAQVKGDYITQRGNAEAAGYTGSANAWTNALSGIGNTAMNYGAMSRFGMPYYGPGAQTMPMTPAFDSYTPIDYETLVGNRAPLPAPTVRSF